VFVIERLGKFHTVLGAGFYFLIPFVDRIAYVHSLKVSPGVEKGRGGEGEKGRKVG
jgi:regulator of protease activity HflC (stomatin/prohibitin superfamily)